MVSFMISPEALECLETMLKEYRVTVYKKFTKTDLFEMGIWNLSQDLKVKSINDLHRKYIGREIRDASY